MTIPPEIRAIILIACMFGQWCIGWWAGKYDWQYPFTVLSVFPFLYVVFMVFPKPEPKKHHEPKENHANPRDQEPDPNRPGA